VSHRTREDEDGSLQSVSNLALNALAFVVLSTAWGKGDEDAGKRGTRLRKKVSEITGTAHQRDGRRRGHYCPLSDGHQANPGGCTPRSSKRMMTIRTVTATMMMTRKAGGVVVVLVLETILLFPTCPPQRPPHPVVPPSSTERTF
jgi:hypothetical protein